MKKVQTIWEKLTIKNKINIFAISVFVALFVVLLLDVWIVKLFLVDFNEIMDANVKGGEIVTAIKREKEVYDALIRGLDGTDMDTWSECEEATRKAIYAVPLSYKSLGDNRYAQLQALRSAYEVYCSYRNQVISDHLSEKIFIDKMYDVYTMQEYLESYAQRFVDATMQEGNTRYRELLPAVIRAPLIAGGLSVILFLFIIHISRVFEIEKQLDTMNLELLKSQINPHFLFNTLNVIAGNANLEGAQTTEQMIEALSSLFRYNLKTHSKEALLFQELKISRDYMYLQKMRFGSRVEFEVDCQVDENKVVVPAFTFQPLLENAIIHGISPKVEGGKVAIIIRETGKKLVIDVVDTGVGMDEDTLLAINRHLKSGEEARDGKEVVGIGLGNIYRRIRAMYDGADMTISSKKNDGTVVTISIPLHGVDD